MSTEVSNQENEYMKIEREISATVEFMNDAFAQKVISPVLFSIVMMAALIEHFGDSAKKAIMRLSGPSCIELQSQALELYEKIVSETEGANKKSDINAELVEALQNVDVEFGIINLMQITQNSNKWQELNNELQELQKNREDVLKRVTSS